MRRGARLGFAVTLVVAAALAIGPRTAAAASADTSPPVVSWRGIAPEPLADSSPITFSYRVRDNLKSSTVAVAVTVYDEIGSLVVASAGLQPQGNQALRWVAVDASGTPLRNGGYRARIDATDPAGNTGVGELRAFRILRPVATTVYERVENAGARVALTFDDCWTSAQWTRMLDTLDALRVRATFFCVGDAVSKWPSLAQRTVAAGHTIGDHTDTHRDLTTLSTEEIQADLRAGQAAWWSAARWTGEPYLRPPMLAYDARVLAAAGSVGASRMILSDVDPEDWRLPGSAVIADRVLASVRGGSIVGLHTLDQTADALGAIVAGLRAAGLEPVTLAELFAAAGQR